MLWYGDIPADRNNRGHDYFYWHQHDVSNDAADAAGRARGAESVFRNGVGLRKLPHDWELAVQRHDVDHCLFGGEGRVHLVDGERLRFSRLLPFPLSVLRPARRFGSRGDDAYSAKGRRFSHLL